jgi:hypothetical protein
MQPHAGDRKSENQSPRSCGLDSNATGDELHHIVWWDHNLTPPNWRQTLTQLCQIKEVSKMRKGLIIPILIGISTEAIADADDISISTKLCMIGAIENYSDAGTV